MPTKTAAKKQGREAAEWAGRAGLAARGFVYFVGSILALRLAFGDRERVDKMGALDAIARQRLGSLLLVVLAVGLAGYAVWRMARVVTGAREGRDENAAVHWLRRGSDLGRAAIYVAFVVSVIRVIFGGRDEASGAEKSADITATLLRQPAGRILVGAVGLAIILAGLVMAWRGLKEKFVEHIDLRRVPRWSKPYLPVVGQIGYVARGLIFALVGWFGLRAAIQYDPQEAVGVSGALGRLAGQPYGPFALALVALGLLAFAALSFIEARYRSVLKD